MNATDPTGLDDQVKVDTSSVKMAGVKISTTTSSSYNPDTGELHYRETQIATFSNDKRGQGAADTYKNYVNSQNNKYAALALTTVALLSPLGEAAVGTKVVGIVTGALGAGATFLGSGLVDVPDVAPLVQGGTTLQTTIQTDTDMFGKTTTSTSSTVTDIQGKVVQKLPGYYPVPTSQ